jgi:predicted transcriptional regulator
MTMLSFRVDEAEAGLVQAWAERLGLDRSELLREALRRHLLRLASEIDAVTWTESPLDDGERAVAAVADWGPAEDWSDWADAGGEVWFAQTPGGDRPVLVLTRDPVADRIGTVVVAALTRTKRGLVSELELTAADDGFRRTAWSTSTTSTPSPGPPSGGVSRP